MGTDQRRPRRRWFADPKADKFASWVRTTPEQRLRSVMHSRLRGPLLWQIFRTIARRAQPDPRVDAVVEFRIAGRRRGGVDRYQLMLVDGRGRTSRRGGRRPALTLELEPVAFLRLVSGTASPQRLLLSGRLKVRGDLILALRLPAILRIPGREVQGRRWGGSVSG